MATIDYEPVVEALEELLSLLDEALEEDENSTGFYEDIQTKAKDMLEWIETNRVATEKQERAVKNWTRAIEESLERARD